MTREELLASLKECLANAGPTTAKHIRAALTETIAFLESPVAVSIDTQFNLLAGQCADELDEALALKLGVMDSDSKAHAINSQRVGAMQAVAARLREAAQQ